MKHWIVIMVRPEHMNQFCTQAVIVKHGTHEECADYIYRQFVGSCKHDNCTGEFKHLGNGHVHALLKSKDTTPYRPVTYYSLQSIEV